MDFKNSKTYQNLQFAFAGESQARNKYTYFASKAKKEGFEEIAQIFTETANNEKEHAKLWYKFLHEGIGTTEENLLLAADGENYEWSDMYKEMANTATKEGFNDIARVMNGVADIEKLHEQRYRQFLKDLKEENLFKKDKKVTWKCLNCGYEHSGTSAPSKCPVCDHPKAYFKAEE